MLIRLKFWLTSAAAFLVALGAVFLAGRREGAQKAREAAKDADQDSAIERQARLNDAKSTPIDDPDGLQRDFRRAVEKHKRNLRRGG